MPPTVIAVQIKNMYNTEAVGEVGTTIKQVQYGLNAW